MSSPPRCPTCGQLINEQQPPRCAVCNALLPAGAEHGDLCEHCALVRALETERYRPHREH